MINASLAPRKPVRLASVSLVILMLAAASLAAGCRGAGPTVGPSPESAAVLKLDVTSGSYADGGTVPPEFTCDGLDRSPHVQWADPPAGARSFAVVLDDPDAPRGVFTHWLVYDIPPGARSLPAGIPPGGSAGPAGTQGRNDFGTTGYRGPCPPGGTTHEYRLYVYALDSEITLAPGASAAQLAAAMRGHVLALGVLRATYQRH